MARRAGKHAKAAKPHYIGYVGGAAVAAGIGAALAVAGQGTAHAEGTDSDTGPKSVNAGPAATDSGKDSSAKTAATKTSTKPVAKFGSAVEKAANEATKTVASAVNQTTAQVKAITKTAAKPATDKASDKPVAKKPKLSAADFEAKQVAKLQEVFTPKAAAVTPAEPKAPTQSSGSSAKAGAVTTAAEPVEESGFPNPFRALDPAPADTPQQIVAIRDALMERVGPEYAPFAREGVEFAWRGSQMIPWVNVVIPAINILDVAPTAIGEGPEALRARQIIVNELLKTTQVGSLLYYGYDEVADLANQEVAGAAFKQTLFVSAWDLLDPLELAHVTGESGLPAYNPDPWA